MAASAWRFMQEGNLLDLWMIPRHFSRARYMRNVNDQISKGVLTLLGIEMACLYQIPIELSIAWHECSDIGLLPLIARERDIDWSTVFLHVLCEVAEIHISGLRDDGMVLLAIVQDICAEKVGRHDIGVLDEIVHDFKKHLRLKFALTMKHRLPKFVWYV